MLILLPVLSLTASTLWLVGRRPPAIGLRMAFLRVLVLHGLLVGISTELLSYWRQLSSAWVICIWAAAAMVGGVALAWRLARASSALRERWLVARSGLGRRAAADQVAVIAIVSVIGLSLFVALKAPPNNPDAVDYHMPRVMHWIQNASVAHYPVHDLRQISFPGWTEYAITHLQLLSGGDHFANSVQWLAFLGCVAGVSLLARSLVAYDAQLITALACASLPMAILQSTTAQTDLVVSLWLVCFCAFALEARRYVSADLFWPAAALALAFLSKPTAYVFAVPLLAMLGLHILARDQGGIRLAGLLRAGSGVACTAVAALCLSVPHFVRNAVTFGDPLGIDSGTRNTIHGLAPLASNALRNVASNLPVPAFWRLVRTLHGPLGLDPSDPATTFSECFFEPGIAMSFLLPDEDLVASPIHLVLLAASLLALTGVAGAGADSRRARLRQLALTVCAGFALYCLLIKWQHWGNRLLLPLAILSCPIIGYALSRSVSARLRLLVASLLAVTAVLYSLVPFRRPLLPLPRGWSHAQSPSILTLDRSELYFSSDLDAAKQVYADPINRMAAHGCRAAGLRLEKPGFEYALWILAAQVIQAPVRFRNVGVRNVSGSLEPEFPAGETCARIVVSQ